MNRRGFLLALLSLPLGQHVVGNLPVQMRSCMGPFTVTLNWLREFGRCSFAGGRLSFFEALGEAFRPRGIRLRKTP